MWNQIFPIFVCSLFLRFYFFLVDRRWDLEFCIGSIFDCVICNVLWKVIHYLHVWLYFIGCLKFNKYEILRRWLVSLEFSNQLYVMYSDYVNWIGLMNPFLFHWNSFGIQLEYSKCRIHKKKRERERESSYIRSNNEVFIYFYTKLYLITISSYQLSLNSTIFQALFQEIFEIGFEFNYSRIYLIWSTYSRV